MTPKRRKRPHCELLACRVRSTYEDVSDLFDRFGADVVGHPSPLSRPSPHKGARKRLFCSLSAKLETWLVRDRYPRSTVFYATNAKTVPGQFYEW